MVAASRTTTAPAWPGRRSSPPSSATAVSRCSAGCAPRSTPPASPTPASGVSTDECPGRRAGAGGEPPGWSDPGPVLEQLRAGATPGAELLLWPGCGVLGRRPAAAAAAVRALDALGVAYQVPDRLVCCGMPALTFGDEAALDVALAA